MVCFNPDKVKHRFLYQAKGAAKKLRAKHGRPYYYYACGNHFHTTRRLVEK